MAQSTVWSTALINETLDKLRMGMPCDMSCFHERDYELKAANILFNYTKEEQEEFIKCSQDIVYFVSKYCRFLNDKGRTTVTLRKYQKDILNTVGEEEWNDIIEDFVPKNRNVIIMASRQVGKTVTISAFFAWYLCFHHDRNAAILANKQITATEIVSKVVDIFKGLPFFLKPGILSIGALGMRLDNGCQLLSQATTKTAQIGFTIHILYADEFAHIQPNIQNDFWRSVYPTLASSNISQCIITSTPAGQSNLFFELWDGAIKKNNSFKPIRVDYWEVPGHDDKWATKMKRDFGEERFAQEFELQFNVSSRLLLGAKEMAFVKRIEKEYIFQHLDNAKISEELYRNLKWHPKFDPNEKWDPEKDKFIISVDTGEGKDEEEKKDNDYNVLSIYKLELKSPASLKKLRKDQYQIKNMFKLTQVGLYRDNIRDEEISAKVCKSLIYDVFGAESCTLVLEMNFNGKNFLSQITSHDDYFDGIVMHTYHTKPIPGEKLPPKKPGFKTTSDKDYYCKLAKRLIAEKTLVPNDVITIKEFGSFGKNEKGKYKGIAMHDDTVMATINISRLYEEESYWAMLEDYIELLPDSKSKRIITEYLNSYVDEQFDTTDNMFKALYAATDDDENINTNLNNLLANNNINRRYIYKSSSSISIKKS